MFGSIDLQCNELNRGHPTFFCQSQDELRTKESEFVHLGPITNETCGEKLFISFNEETTKYSLLGATNFENQNGPNTYIFSNDGLTEEKEIQRKFDLYFQICFPNDLTVANVDRHAS